MRKHIIQAFSEAVLASSPAALVTRGKWLAESLQQRDP